MASMHSAILVAAPDYQSGSDSMSEKENPLQAIFQTFEKISHGVRTYLSQFAYLTDHNYPSPTNGQPLFSLFSSFKANPLIASEHSTLFQPKEILNELKDYESGSDSMFEKENPLQSIFQTFEKISHGVRIYLSQFACLTNNNYPTPTNGRPLFSLSSSFKANPLIASEHSTLFQPKEILNEGKSATPVTKEELGRATWTFLHTLAAQYPDNPTRQQRKDVKELMEILSRMYPCKDCADHFKEILRANPVQAGSQAEFSQWLCHAHNVVNRSLGKLVFPCERVDARWGKMECEQRACDLQGTTTFFGDNMR